MLPSHIRCTLLPIIVALSACGGGSSESDSSSPNNGNSPSPTSSEMIRNASNYSAAQLTNAANQLVSASYKGKETPATNNLVRSQKLVKDTVYAEWFVLPNLYLEQVSEKATSSGEVDFSLDCGTSGKVVFKGKVNTDGIGTVALSYQNCVDEYKNRITGNAAVMLKTVTEDAIAIDMVFDNLSITLDGKVSNLTGSYGFKSVNYPARGEQEVDSSANLLLIKQGQPQELYQVELSQLFSYYTYTFEARTSYFNADLGKLTLVSNGVKDYFTQGSFEISGTSKTKFELVNGPVKYLEDQNSDNTYDVGTYFASFDELMVNFENKPLVNIGDMSLPPYVNAPWVNVYEVYTSTPIEVSPGHYSDPDNELSELAISYRWYINGELVEGQTSNIFPPYLAVFGDVVAVSMVVSDGVNSVESLTRQIEILDSPGEFVASNLPNQIMAGETVQFNVLYSDPDHIQADQSGYLVSAPTGVSIDSNGLLTWQISDEYLFPIQSVDFVFAIKNAQGDIIDQNMITLDVTTNKPFPVVRSGIEVPLLNHGMAVGDFTGDNRNEILVTDNRQRLMILEENQGKYNQTWLYPFALPTDGEIKQIIPMNLDEDSALEALIVTRKGISLINGTETLATDLFKTDKNIIKAAVADVDNNGVLDIAYIEADEYYYNVGNRLNVVSFDDPTSVIFTTTVNEAADIVFADVDDEVGLELIVNTGLVYDATTWVNKWASSTVFGSMGVVVGDFTGDGKLDIAGADSWDRVALYSARTKSQITSLESFNNCSISVANVDNDVADELILGACQWGNVQAFNLVNNQLNELWAINSQDHGTSSLTLGDSDNDGQLELHWGTGTSSSGEDHFVVADLTIDSIEIKPNNTAVQLDSFTSAGWSFITEGDEKAVFFVPRTSSGYSGSRILTMTADGQYEISSEISSNYDGSVSAVATDFNRDGFGDIFMPTTDYYQGKFAAMQLLDLSLHWSSNASYDSRIGTILAHDVTQDDKDDAIYIEGKTLNIINVDNESIVAKHTFDRYINDVDINRITNNQLVVANTNTLSLFKLNGSVLSEKTYIEQECHLTRFFNYDTDADLEVLCIYSPYYDADAVLRVFDIENDQFKVVAEHQLNHSIIDIQIDNTTDVEQNYFVTLKKNHYSYGFSSESYQLSKYTAKHQLIWRSPNLLDVPSYSGLKIRQNPLTGTQIQLATQSAMYLIN